MPEQADNPSLASTIVNNEQAKAVTALSNFGATAVTESSNLARYIGRIIGTAPEDTVGLIIGDPLHAVRTLAASWYDSKVREILDRRAVKETAPVSPSVALPLIRGAYDESREGLRDMWAALIAAAMDPKRSDRIRLSFMEALKNFDPIDAVILKERNEIEGDPKPTVKAFLQNKLNISQDELNISIGNLEKLNCAADMRNGNFIVTPQGRGILRAVAD